MWCGMYVTVGRSIGGTAKKKKKRCSVPSSPNPFIVSLPLFFANTHHLPSLGKIIPGVTNHLTHVLNHANRLSPSSHLQMIFNTYFNNYLFFVSRLVTIPLTPLFDCSLSLLLSPVSSGKTSSLRYLLARRFLPRQWKHSLRAGEQVPRYFTSPASFLSCKPL